MTAVAFAASGKAENLVSNPGFEEVANDSATAWRLPLPQFSVTNETPRNGGRCLRLENHDAKKYLLASSSPKLMPGHRYEIEAWIRTQGVTSGDGGGATLCVEWNDASGHFIGGEYPHGLTGTHTNWTRVNAISGRIPTNAARFNISCYMRRGATGIAWWDDVEIREYRPPVLNAMTTDRYRDQSDGGIVRVHAGLALQENNIDAASVRVAVAVNDSAGHCAATASVISVTSDETALAFDAAPLAAGSYNLICTVRDATAREIGSRSLPFTRVTKFEQRKSFIDEHRRLIVDGQPFFPLGTYWGGVSPEHMAIYTKSPFNCIMPYADIGRGGADLAWSNGIRVIYSVKDLYPGHGKIKTSDEARQTITRKVTELKDHPAIIAWYINDELPITMCDELSAHRRWLEELDPGRPTWAVLYQVDQLRDYLPTFDVAGADPYPIGRHPVALARDWARTTREATFGSRAVWMVPQIFDWASYNKTDQSGHKQRPPTLDEMRCMAWSCIAEGANGLIFYSWFDLWRMDKTPAEGGRTAVREPFEDRWRDVTTMAAEIRDFIPVLLSVEPAPAPKLEAPPLVSWRVLAKDGIVWLIAVNNDEQNEVPVAVHFAESFRKAAARSGGAQIPGGGNAWKLTIPPRGVQLVRFER